MKNGKSARPGKEKAVHFSIVISPTFM